MRKHIKVSIQKPNKLLMSDERRTSSGETPPPRRARNTILSRAHGHPRDRENSTENTSRQETSIARYEFTRIARVHPLSCPHLAREKKRFRAPFLLPAEKPRHFFARRRMKGVKISAQIYTSRAKFSRTILYSNNIKRTLATVFSKSVGLTPASFTILERDICSVQCCEDETFVKLFGTLKSFGMGSQYGSCFCAILLVDE